MAAILQTIRQALGDQARFESVANENGRGDAGVGVDAGDADGVVVIPAEPRALVKRVVVLRLVDRSVRIEHLVVEETDTVPTGRVPPRKRTAIADPRSQAPVEMHRGSIVALACTTDRQVIGNDVFAGREVVSKSDLDRLAFVRDDDAAEMPMGLTCEQSGGAIAA